MSHASLPYSFWFYAVQTAISLINLHPTSVLQSHSPWSKLYHSKPTLYQLKVFACSCYPYLRPYTSHKLEPRTQECTFIGYSVQSKGYLCHGRSTQTIYTSRHVLLNESLFPFASPNTFHTYPSVSPASSSSIDPLQLSNLLHLHSTNAHSLLGTVPTSTSPHSTPISSLDPLPNSFALPSSTVPDSVPPSEFLPTTQSQPPLPVVNVHPMQTRSNHGITKPKLCYQATIDCTKTEPPNFKVASNF